MSSTVAAAIMKIVYGIDAKDEHDPTIDLIAAAIDAVTPAVVPGSYLVDALPFLRYVPAWFPGAGFQKQFATFRKSNERIQDVPYSLRKVDGVSLFVPLVDECLVARIQDKGAGGRPLVDLMLSQSEGYADAEGMVKRLGAVAFFGARYDLWCGVSWILTYTPAAGSDTVSYPNDSRERGADVPRPNAVVLILTDVLPCDVALSRYSKKGTRRTRRCGRARPTPYLRRP